MSKRLRKSLVGLSAGLVFFCVQCQHNTTQSEKSPVESKVVAERFVKNPKKDKSLSLLLSYRLLLNLEPCGCEFRPLGGMPRVWNKIEHWKSTLQDHVLWLIMGPILMPARLEYDSRNEKQYVLRRKHVAQALQALKASLLASTRAELVWGVAGADTRKGVARVRDFARRAGIVPLSTNLVSTSKSQFLFNPAVWVDGHHVLLFHLSEAAQEDGYRNIPGVKVLPNEEALRRAMAQDLIAIDTTVKG